MFLVLIRYKSIIVCAQIFTELKLPNSFPNRAPLLIKELFIKELCTPESSFGYAGSIWVLHKYN